MSGGIRQPSWSGGSKLGKCSLGARGLYIEMIGIMHHAEPRGSMVNKNGSPVTNKQLARIARCTVHEVSKYLAELDEAGVLSFDPDGTIFSDKMRAAERASEIGRKTGKMGGNPYEIERARQARGG